MQKQREVWKRDFDNLRVRPFVGDFTKLRDLGDPEVSSPLGFFSGSTIGNLTHEESVEFLRNAAQLLGPGSAFLIGVDLQKSLDILIPAYDDASGVTASFSLNLLTRINRELEANFDVACFAHRALYNSRQGRIEIYLESLADQTVDLLGQHLSFSAGERIHTETPTNTPSRAFRPWPNGEAGSRFRFGPTRMSSSACIF